MSEVIIGEYTYGFPLIRRGSMNKITIGNYCSIAEGVIWDSGFGHNTKFISTFPFGLPGHPVCKGDIIVGNDVWIGEGAVIMSGVTIGDGAVIGMRAIISKNVLPYEIVVGAPQKVLKKRFSDELIGELLKIKWWNWSDEKVKENAHLLMNENIDEFINKHKHGSDFTEIQSSM